MRYFCGPNWRSNHILDTNSYDSLNTDQSNKTEHNNEWNNVECLRQSLDMVIFMADTSLQSNLCG